MKCMCLKSCNGHVFVYCCTWRRQHCCNHTGSYLRLNPLSNGKVTTLSERKLCQNVQACCWTCMCGHLSPHVTQRVCLVVVSSVSCPGTGTNRFPLVPISKHQKHINNVFLSRFLAFSLWFGVIHRLSLLFEVYLWWTPSGPGQVFMNH